MVGMETDHGCGRGGNRRCSCLDSPGFVCVCVWRAAFSVSEEKFHRCYRRLPQGRFIYFRRPVTQTRLHEQRRAHFLLVLIFLFFWKTPVSFSDPPHPWGWPMLYAPPASTDDKQRARLELIAGQECRLLSFRRVNWELRLLQIAQRLLKHWTTRGRTINKIRLNVCVSAGSEYIVTLSVWMTARIALTAGTYKKKHSVGVLIRMISSQTAMFAMSFLAMLCDEMSCSKHYLSGENADHISWGCWDKTLGLQCVF